MREASTQSVREVAGKHWSEDAFHDEKSFERKFVDAAEQDFKVNLKSELMLDNLTRNDRERSAQMEQLIGVLRSIRERTALDEDKDHLGAAVDEQVAQ